MECNNKINETVNKTIEVKEQTYEQQLAQLEKELEVVKEDRENKKQALLVLLVYNMKLFAEKDEDKILEIKKEMNDFVNKINSDGILD